MHRHDHDLGIASTRMTLTANTLTADIEPAR